MQIFAADQIVITPRRDRSRLDDKIVAAARQGRASNSNWQRRQRNLTFARRGVDRPVRLPTITASRAMQLYRIGTQERCTVLLSRRYPVDGWRGAAIFLCGHDSRVLEAGNDRRNK